MVGAGELAAEDGSYRLAGARLLDRQSRQAASRRATTRAWRGRWVLAVVVAERRTRADRVELREELAAARLAELREGVWVAPDNIDVAWPPVVTAHCTIVTDARLDPALAVTLWDLEAWSAERRSPARRACRRSMRAARTAATPRHSLPAS